MAKPRSDPLRLIDTIYRFPGGLRGPGEVDIERPVSIVHDVAPAAGRSAIIEYVYEQTQITDGLGNVDFQSVDKNNLITSVAAIRNRARNLGLNAGNADVWLLGVAAAITQATQGNLSSCSAFLYPEIVTSELYSNLIANFDTLLTFASESGGPYRPLYSGTDLIIPMTLPRRVGQIRTRALDGGAGAAEYSFRFLIAITPKGVNPQPW